MPRLLLAFALLLIAAAPRGAAAEPWCLEQSEVRAVTAPDGHVYQVSVAWPEGEPPATGWPVLWVLDGEDNFAIATLTARRLARAGERSGIAPGVIVGVDSGPLARRVFDYTPSIDGYSIPQGAPAHGLPVGGADAFLDFLERKVRPMIGSHGRVDPERQTLMGHSFGALLALYALNKGRNWSGYVAVSPSLWYGGGDLPRGNVVKAREVPIASGSEERQVGGDAEEEEIAELTRDLAANGIPVRSLSLRGHGHGTTMLAAMGEAISMAFGRDDR